jgi:ankyrin repeat protein
MACFLDESGRQFQGASQLAWLVAKGADLTRRQVEMEPSCLNSTFTVKYSKHASDQGVTALYWAIFTYQTNTALLLLRNGALVNTVVTTASLDQGAGEQLVTPLYWAAAHGLSSVVAELLDKGASVTLGRNPRRVAATHEINEMLRNASE